MYGKMIRNGTLRNKTLSFTIAAFVAAAALLVALAATLTVHLAGAIDTLMERAETPHFMQMHSGALDLGRLHDFAAGRAEVRDFQVREFLNLEGERIVLGSRSLGASVQDNGLSTQGERFDYLLDLDGNRIEARDGELYVPVCYLKDGSARLGEPATVCGRPFRIAGFLRDSQMNSLLSSSKRFLVSGNDYAALRGSGNVEYLIEFRLDSPDAAGPFEAAYAAAGLEANGPTLTYPLFRTINAVSDGLMIAVILLVSLLVVLIAFLCIRFALLAQIEDEYREIGVMKAIGLQASDMRRLYLVRYAALAAAGALAGLGLSIPCREPLLANIRLTMGDGGNDAAAVAFALIGVSAVFLSVVAFVNGVLRRFRKLSAAQAIRFSAEAGKASGAKGFTIPRNAALGANVFLGAKDVLSRKRLYGTMLAVFSFALFIMIVPRNVYGTISSAGFIAYMGVGQCDLRLDIQQTDDIPRKAAEIAEALRADGNIARFAAMTTKSFAVAGADGGKERIKVELGDHAAFPLRYASGRAPRGENEIALSNLNAEALGVGTGDQLRLVVGGRERDFAVSGIYPDITNGGKTAKAAFSDDSGAVMWCVVNAELTDPARVAATAEDYAARFPYAKVSGIREYVLQTFGPTVDAVEKASYAAIAAAIAVSALVTLLFVRLLVAKDRADIAAMKALGFLDSEIRIQYLARTALVFIAGAACGMVLAETLGESIAGALLAAFGASSFAFAKVPAAARLLYPLLLAVPAAAAALLGASRIRRISISEYNKE